MPCWLMKTEPGTYSFQRLLQDGRTNWNEIRNYQARNYLREARRGDSVLIYHSGDERSVIGIAKVVREAYPDPDPEQKGDWVQVDLVPVRKLGRAVSLAEIKTRTELRDLALLKQSRLSVVPVSERHFATLLKLGQAE